MFCGLCEDACPVDALELTIRDGELQSRRPDLGIERDLRKKVQSRKRTSIKLRAGLQKRRDGSHFIYETYSKIGIAAAITIIHGRRLSPTEDLRDVHGTNNLVGQPVDLLLLVPGLIGVELHIPGWWPASGRQVPQRSLQPDLLSRQRSGARSSSHRVAIRRHRKSDGRGPANRWGSRVEFSATTAKTGLRREEILQPFFAPNEFAISEGRWRKREPDSELQCLRSAVPIRRKSGVPCCPHLS